MGKPDDSTELEMLREVASALLHPTKGVPVAPLRNSGLHRVMVANGFESLTPEIKDLAGWKSLQEYSYKMPVNADREIFEEGEKATARWLEKLREANLSDHMAILLYDGDRTGPVSARRYRLYLLRDGRVLYYEGGINTLSLRPKIVCGGVLDVLDALDASHERWRRASDQPFLIMLSAFSRALENAMSNRERKLKAQGAVKKSIDASIARVTFK